CAISAEVRLMLLPFSAPPQGDLRRGLSMMGKLRGFPTGFFGKRRTAGNQAVNGGTGSAFFLSGVPARAGGYRLKTRHDPAVAESAHRAPAAGWKAIPPFFLFRPLADGRGDRVLGSGVAEGRAPGGPAVCLLRRLAG